jgi:two-component system, NarL family, response regulator NreC
MCQAAVGVGARMIRIVVADDHAIVRTGIRALLAAAGDMQLVGEAGDGRVAVETVGRLRPDILLLDLTMPELGGLEVIARARAASPQTRVIVLSMHAEADFVRPALRNGARGYVVKGSGLDDLIKAIRVVASGERFFDPSIASIAEGDALDPRRPVDDLDQLTPREREILQLVAEGHTNKVIGQRLGLSTKTVDVHRTNVMRKLDLHNAQALTRFAIRRGLIHSG